MGAFGTNGSLPMRDADGARTGRGGQASPAQPDITGPADMDLAAFFGRLDALWERVRRRGVMRNPAPDTGDAIAAVARSARESGLRPEQFLWLVKKSWAAQPDVRTAADPLATREVLSRIITVCIHEFYRE